jgi:hypothetical protein
MTPTSGPVDATWPLNKNTSQNDCEWLECRIGLHLSGPGQAAMTGKGKTANNRLYSGFPRFVPPFATSLGSELITICKGLTTPN